MCWLYVFVLPSFLSFSLFSFQPQDTDLKPLFFVRLFQFELDLSGFVSAFITLLLPWLLQDLIAGLQVCVVKPLQMVHNMVAHLVFD